MLCAIRKLLGQIIDYAGLFPPAKLPLERAMHDYAAYRQHTFQWMLSRFVCPTRKFSELDAYADPLFRTADQPWRFSALGRSGQDATSFAAGLSEDLDAMRRLAERHQGRALADALETRLPESLVTACDQAASQDLVDKTAETVASPGTGLSDTLVQVFLEIPLLGEWRRNTATVIAAVGEHNQSTPPEKDGRPIGVKIRTGGVQASMIPSVEQVAFFIHCCREHCVPFKATAGLHHPLRHESSEVGAKMHGFLNVFGAAVLSHAVGISESTVTRMLEEETMDGFVFDDTGMSWHEHHVSPDQIARSRREFAISLGSCSFLEPIEDLRGLELV